VGQVVDGTGGQRSGVGAGGLDTTNAMLRSVIDGIADLVYAKDAEGRIAGVVGVSRDVTEEERAESDRRRLLGRLHDIQ
jgi:signal transduction histidine kinase